MKPNDLKLLLLYLVLCVAILFRVVMEESGYTSPDSGYYLEIAQNLISGNGLTMTDPGASGKAFAAKVPLVIWPAGYPALIAAVALVTGLSVFWASKVLNLLLLGGCLLLLRVILKEKAWLAGLLFCSYTLLEIYSYTWSEAPFLYFLLLFSVALHTCASTYGQCHWQWWLWLLVGSVAMFLCRYIGLFAVPVLGLFGLYFLWKKQSTPGVAFLVTALVTGLLVAAYFYRNYQLAGALSGSSREFAQEESRWFFSWILVRGLLHELVLARKLNFNGGPDPLFWLMALVQWGLAGWLYIRHLRGRIRWQLGSPFSYCRVFLAVAGAYLVVLAILRLNIPFDSFDFRMMSPAMLLAWLALLLVLLQPANEPVAGPVRKYLLLFFMLSLLVNVLKLTYLKALL